MKYNTNFIIRYPAPLEHHKLLADTVYRWIAVIHLLLVTVGTLFVLLGL